MKLEEVRQLKVTVRDQLEKVSFDPGVCGEGPVVTLGIGRRPGSESGDFWLTARVRTPVRDLQAEEQIRAMLVKVADKNFDLRYTGPVFALRPFAFTARTTGSKLTIGSSVSHFRTLGGTLGFFARSRGDNTRGFVSANHVIANVDRADVGDAVVSPALSSRRVGGLVRFTALGGGGEKRTDAAFASLDTSVNVDRSSLPNGMTLSATPAPPEESTRVMKVGARTGFTVGNVTSFDHDAFRLPALAGIGSVDFDDQIEIEPANPDQIFAAGGDSGSLAFDDQGRAVGLLFGVGSGLAYVNPIQFVLDDLAVDLDVT